MRRQKTSAADDRKALQLRDELRATAQRRQHLTAPVHDHLERLGVGGHAIRRALSLVTYGSPWRLQHAALVSGDGRTVVDFEAAHHGGRQTLLDLMREFGGL